MDQMQSTLGAAAGEAAGRGGDGRDPLVGPGGNLVLLAMAANGRALPGTRVDTSPLGRKWPGLLERVQGAAQHIREVESWAQEQEQRTQDLLKQVRTDMQAAMAQVQAAQQQARDVQVQANKLIKGAEDRAAAAEERALAAEQMIQALAEMIETEFAVRPADKLDQGAGFASGRDRPLAMRTAS